MKPVSLGAAWLETVAFIKREAGLLVPAILLFIAVPLIAILLAVPPQMREMPAGSEPAAVEIGDGVIFLVTGGMLVMFGGLLVCFALALKPGISMGEALKLGFRRLPVALGAALIMALAVMVPAVVMASVSKVAADFAVVIAAMLISARMIFVNALIVDRPVGVIESVRQSWNLSRGQFGRLLLCLVAIAIPTLLSQAVAGMLLGLPVIAFAGAEAGARATDAAGAIVMALGQMVLAVMTSRLYRQLVPAS